ncbi:MAG: hypothetical protein LQ341_005762 [Variospora aurantia]|nr:MAG: hypothetical protein LQ341_005762 [Variospora aurantia]
MSHIDQQSQSLLYHNKEKTVVLIDIPRSIAEAQGTPDAPSTQSLYSSPPLEKPHQSIEPRSLKAMQEVRARLPSEGDFVSSFPQDLLAYALAEIKAEHSHGFCSERRMAPSKPTGKKRQRSSSGTSLALETKEKLEPIETGDFKEKPEATKDTLLRSTVAQHVVKLRNPRILPISAAVDGYEVAQMLDVADQVVSNPFTQPARLLVLDPARGYRIPPRSTFLLSKVGRREALLFGNAAYKLFPEPTMSAAPGQFDFILLDPPWDNKSVRRSKQYQTGRRAADDPIDILQDTLGKHLAPKGLVACWITNKRSTRDTALQLFESWHVVMLEAWAWLKTTVHGDPICALDGIVRRPYETLLIGRQVDLAGDRSDDPALNELIKHRVMVGVPDLHSRKPCVKTLIEPMMKDSSNYRALEVFARNLTAGWWSWGDEVLQYNWEKYWTENEPRNVT